MTTPALPVLDPTAAAIDVGSEQLHVSIAGGPPKIFGTTTGQLHALRNWLKESGARTVAMEATGIYWLCPYEVLEQAGLEVVVVNGKYVKNLPGRKTDMKACQWQATLHAHGLLKPGFVPPEHIRRLQDYLRPLLEEGIDQLVLGCTHFPFLIPVLSEIVGPQVEIVDPSPAVARQTGRVIAAQRNAPGRAGQVTYFTSGDAERFHRLAERLVDEPIAREQVHIVRWVGDEVVLGT